MHKLFTTIIEAVYWIGIFLSPTLAFGFAALIVYIYQPENIVIPICIISIGAILGIIWAEYVRRKHGCSHYIGKILSTPDICPDESNEKVKEE